MPVKCTITDIKGATGRPDEHSVRLSTKDDPLARSAAQHNAKAYQTDSGQVFATFQLGRRQVPVRWPDRASAEAAFRHLDEMQLKEATAASEAGRQAERVQLDIPEAPYTYVDMDPTLRVDQVVHGETDAPLTDPWRYITGHERVLGPNSAVTMGEMGQVKAGLTRMGESGRMLQDMFERKNDLAEKFIGTHVADIERALQGLTEEEIAFGLRRHRELGAPASPQVQAASEQLTQIFRRIGDTALELGLDVPEYFDPRTYWPHRYDINLLEAGGKGENLVRAYAASRGLDEATALAQLKNQGLGTTRDEAIRRMMEKGKYKTRTEAEHVLDRWITANRTMRSSNLEYERMLDIEPIEHARRALMIYATDVGERLASAQTLGVDYSIANSVIDRIRLEQGTRAADFAKEVMDLEVGRIRPRLEGIAEGLYDWQAAKLSLSMLANSTQSFNVALRTDLRSLAAGLDLFARKDLVPAVKQLAREGLGKESRTKAAQIYGQHAREVGALAHDILNEVRYGGASALLSGPEMPSLGRRVVRGIGDASLKLFNLAEVANRAIATHAGEHYFDATIRALRDNPADKMVARRLRELGMTPEAVLNAAPGELAEMRYLAGKRISDETQFKSDIQSRPLWATSHPLGKFVFQFKTFATNQASFMVNEILRDHGDPKRNARALALLMTAWPALGVALTEVRSGLMGETITSEVIKQARTDPTVANLVKAGAVAVATVGSLGIVADLAATAASGNKFALTAFFISPAASTAINALDVGASVVKGAITRDSEYIERAFRTGAREFGGVGSTLVQQTVGEPSRASDTGGFR